MPSWVSTRELTPAFLCRHPGRQSKRCTAEQALEHVYAAEFHNPEDEPCYPGGDIRIAIDDNTKLSAADYRER
jgi:hypothetical protein